MRGSEFEFRYRFFVIGAIYGIAFSCYSFDHVNAGYAIARAVLGHSPMPGVAHDQMAVRCVFGVGALLAIAAAAIRTWGAAFLKSSVVHDMDLHSEALVADGPFRYVRNPLYLGGVLLAAGIGLMASRAGLVALVVLHYLFYMRLILREEGQLLGSQGESFAAYCRAVPRLWPALQPKVAAGGVKAQWGQAFLGESFLWGIAVAVAVFAVTLKQNVAFGIMDFALLGYVVYVFGFRRRRRRRPEQAQ